MRFAHRTPKSLLRVVVLALFAPVPARAQLPVTKPTTTYTRPPAPSAVIARQQPDGTILVTWPAIAGAATYQVTRSVPPAAAQVVANPTDTSYVDTNVQAGSSYYYMVAAVDASGAVGLKRGSQPVTATAIVAAPAGTATTPTSGATSSVTATAPSSYVLPVPPDAVSVDASWPRSAIVYFGFRQSGMSYRIERAIALGSSKTAAVWQLRQTTAVLPCCSYSVVDSTSDVPTGQSVTYRVTTVSSTGGTRTPPATVSPTTYLSVSTAAAPTANAWKLTAPVRTLTVRAGTMVNAGGSKATTFDPAVVSVGPGGSTTAVAPGVTYVFYSNVSASGQPSVRVERVTVVP